ncbi:MAG: hypothetical protein KDA24_11945 [Deltaproteobacteria bacterium]|nr:hypothetical protein [Deltaproteobacteria bacterium]
MQRSPLAALLLPVLLAVPSVASADTLSCDDEAVEAKRSGTLVSTDGGRIDYEVCTATADSGRLEGALWASLREGKQRQLVQSIADGPADDWRLELGGGVFLLDFPCSAETGPGEARCVRSWEVRGEDFAEETAQVRTPWEVGAQRIELMLADGRVEAARGVAMRLGPPPRHITNGEERVFFAFLQNAWFRAGRLRESGDLRGATEAMMAFFAQPPVLASSSQMFLDKITLRPGYGAYSIPGQIQVRANEALVARLVDGASILSAGGERRRASEILTEVVRVVPNNADAWLVLGDVHWNQRLKHQAMEAYKKYLELAGIGDDEIPPRVVERLAP